MDSSLTNEQVGARIDQALSYLQMAREASESGDKEGEAYWMERTQERTRSCMRGPSAIISLVDLF